MKSLSPLAKQVWCDPGFQCELTERLVEFEENTAGGLSQLFANQVWIDTLGNDDTGEINNPERPFLTGAAAATAMAATIAEAENVAFHFGVGEFTMTLTPDVGVISLYGAGITATVLTLTVAAEAFLDSDKSLSVNLVSAANAITATGVHFNDFSGTTTATVLKTLTDCHVGNMTGVLSLDASDSFINNCTVTNGTALTLRNVRGGTWSWTSTAALTMSMLTVTFTSFTVVATAAGLTGNLAVLNGFTSPAATFTVDASDDIKILNPGITTTFVITTASSEVITFGGATKVATGAGTHTNTGALTAVYA